MSGGKRDSNQSGSTVRLQKFLSDAGAASRRRAEELILAGRVLVNGRVVDSLPAFIDPQSDEVIVDGSRVRQQRLDYFVMHKPKGVVCTTRDPAGRTRAIDLLPELNARLFVVGRLDVDSTGLLLLTNDGELAERVTHPRYGLPKVYHVEVRGQISDEAPRRLREGVHLSDGKARATDVEVIHRSRERSVIELTLREGRNRIVRRLFAKLGYPVRKLKRIQIGPLTGKGLPVGACRRLSTRELMDLRQAVEGIAVAKPRRPRRPRSAEPTEARPATKRASAPAKGGRRTGLKKPAGRKTDDSDSRKRRRIVR